MAAIVNVNVNIICLPTGYQFKEFKRTHSEMSVHSRSNWNLEMLVFEERGIPEYPEKNLSEQSREPTTNSTQI